MGNHRHATAGLTGTALLGTALLGTALLAAGCGSAPARPQHPADLVMGVAVREPASSPRPYGTADTAFGLDVLRSWCRQDPRSNIVFSPESLATGLGMVYLGARGSTAHAMERVLHVPAAGKALLAGLQARSGALRALDEPGVKLATADQVWADPSLITRRGYLDNVATGYAAGVRRVPLLTEPDQVTRQINAAISAATAGHIPRLLAPGSLQNIGWVLTDALYLKASWARGFETSMTRTGQFTSAGGNRVRVRYLNGSGYRFDRADGWTAVALPYRGGKLSMVALLPGSGAAGSGAAGSGGSRPSCPALRPAALSKIIKGLSGSPAAGGPLSPDLAGISMPKLKLRTSAGMVPLLGRLGMGIAFGPGADFTGLSPQAGAIARVVHAATLRVDEEGTVASAATAVGVLPTSLPAPPRRIITFNRPYLLLVTDTATGEPLFLARVADPAAS
jgi:serpin B